MEARIKTAFVSSVLKETAERIYTEQQQAASDWNLFNTGELDQSLKGHFSIANNEGGAKLSMGYLKYARWLDMKDDRRKIKREGFHLYNRILFGNIYSYAKPRIMYELTDELRAQIGQELADIEAAKYPTGKQSSMVLSLIETKIDRNLAAVIAKSARTGY